MRNNPAILIFILLVLLVSNPNSLFSQSFNPSASKQETIKFIDDILKKKLGTRNNWTVSQISFNENGYKISEGNDTIKYTYEYTSIPWENVKEINRFKKMTGFYIIFRRPALSYIRNNKPETGRIIDFSLPENFNPSDTEELEQAVNHLVSLIRKEKGVSNATLEETLSYLKTRLGTYQQSRDFMVTIDEQKIDQPLSYNTFYKTVMDHVTIYYSDLKSIELLQGNIVLSGKVNIYGNPTTRPSAVTIYLTDQMPLEDKQKLLKAFKHIAYLLEVKLSNNDLF